MAERVSISIYKNLKDRHPHDTGLDDFLRGVKEGRWQDETLRVRTIKDKKQRAAEKQKICPLVRVSGSFSGYSDKDLRKHSGFIAIDVDGVENPNTIKELVANDPYLYSAFVSISGTGVCLVFKIDGTRHADSFEGLSTYLYDSYQIISDQSCKNVSRARFISFDPYLIQNSGALLFKKYSARKKAKPVNAVAVVKSDFDEIVNQLFKRGINICESYQDWVSCAYSLISEFRESGLPYFHTLSSMSGKYNGADCDRQYENCLRSHADGKAKNATIASIYFHAKQAGVDIYSARTREIIRTTVQQTKSGATPESILAHLEKHHEIPVAESAPVVKQILEKGVEYQSENIIDDLQAFYSSYGLRKNLLTRNVERNGKPLDDSDINSLYIDARSVYDKATKDLVCSIIFSNRTEQYHPIKDFLLNAPDFDPFEPTPNLDKLLDSITTDTENYRKWITKWLVGMIGSVYGQYCPLTLVFAGEKQGTGKTHFFRYLLPKELRSLYAESDMDDGKDDAILMTRKLIIVDDEYGGKSKREFTKQKKISSKEWVNVREPYGRVSVDLRRLSMFAGTSNDLQIIADPTGNRRTVPIHITDVINRELYNACDKVELMYELYNLYRGGYDFSILGDDVKLLNENTDQFKISSHEEELILRKLSPATDTTPGYEMLSITEIIQYLIADTKINSLSNTRIGMLLTSMKFEKRRIWSKETNNTINIYVVLKINSIPGTQQKLPY